MSAQHLDVEARPSRCLVTDRLSNLGAGLLVGFSAIFLAIVFLLSFFCTGLMFDAGNELQTLSWLFSADWAAPLCGIVCAAALGGLLFFGGNLSKVLPEKALIAAVVVVTTVFSAWWVICQNAVNSGFPDSQRLLTYACAAAKGDWSYFANEGAATLEALDGNACVYFSYYPYQCGVFCYFYLVYKVVGDAYAFVTLQFINVLFNEVTLLVVYAMGRRFVESKSGRARLALLLFGCLPLHLSAGFVYGNSVGFGLGVLFLYLQFVALTCDGLRSRLAFIGASVVPLAFMMIIKSTFVLFGIAAAIAWLYRALRDRRPLPLVLLCCCLFAASKFSAVPTALVEAKTGNDFGDGMPKTSWIVLGTDTSEINGMAGWWDTRAAQIFVKANGDVFEQSRLALEQLASNVSGFISVPEVCLRFFGEKLATEWAEPTFGSVLYSNVNAVRYSNEQFDGYGALGAEAPGGAWTVYMDGYQLLVCSLGLVSLIQVFAKRDWNPAKLLLVAVFFTGFGCYLLWEAKSVYVLPFFVLLIPLAADGFERRILIASAAPASSGPRTASGSRGACEASC